MRIVTKKELLELPPYTIFRAWEPSVYDYDEWVIKTGKDFGAYELSPNPAGDASEEVEPVYDWDGKLDEKDEQLFAVLEKQDIVLMQNRLALVMEKCDFAAIAATGIETFEVMPRG